MGWIVHKQTLDLAAMLGMGLIVSGVLVINIFSKSGAH
jgi:small multidrug resistance pump